jgi:hypothetical protein
VLAVLGLTAACGKTDTTESGETHFVTCSVDDDCQGLSDVPTCSGGYCRDQDGNKLPDTAANNNTSSNDSGPAACADGCGNSECATPGNCTLAAACQVVDCGNALVDQNACVRPQCASDADCPEDERCLSDMLARKYQCEQHGSSCSCTSGLGLFPTHLCSPTELAGVRGTWQQLVMDEIVIGESTKRTFLPDGSVTIVGPDGQGQTTTTMKQLSAEDLDELNRDIDGPLLRLGLATEQNCPVTKATDLDVQLVLDTTTLEQNVAGCALEGTVPIFQSLHDLALRY